jgi:hypothetical protein
MRVQWELEGWANLGLYQNFLEVYYLVNLVVIVVEGNRLRSQGLMVQDHWLKKLL